jgi:hypothetical protein
VRRKAIPDLRCDPIYSSVQQSEFIYEGLTFQHKTTGDAPAGNCFCAPANAAAFTAASYDGLAMYSMDGDELHINKQLDIPRHLGTVWACDAAADLLVFWPRKKDRLLKLLHIPSSTAIAPAGLPGAVTCAAVSADGLTLMAGDDRGNVALWRVEGAGSLEATPVVGPAHVQQQAQAGGAADSTSSHITCCSLSADGLLAVSGSSNGAVAVWQCSSGHLQLVGQLAAPAAVTCCSMSADGQRLAVGCSDGSVWCWSWHGGAAAVVIGPTAVTSDTHSTGLPDSSEELGQHQHRSRVTCCALSADGALMASGDSAGMVVIWDLTPPQPEAAMAIQQHDSAATCCTFLPDGGQQHLPRCSAADIVLLRAYARVMRDAQGISYLHRPGTRSPALVPPAQQQQLAAATAAGSDSGQVVGFCPLLDPSTGASCGEVMIVQRSGTAIIAGADGCHREFLWQLDEAKMDTLGPDELTELEDIGATLSGVLSYHPSADSSSIRLCKFQNSRCSRSAEQHMAVAWDSNMVAVVSSTTGKQLGVGLCFKTGLTRVKDIFILGDAL